MANTASSNYHPSELVADESKIADLDAWVGRQIVKAAAEGVDLTDDHPFEIVHRIPRRSTTGAQINLS